MKRGKMDKKSCNNKNNKIKIFSDLLLKKLRICYIYGEKV